MKRRNWILSALAIPFSALIVKGTEKKEIKSLKDLLGREIDSAKVVRIHKFIFKWFEDNNAGETNPPKCLSLKIICNKSERSEDIVKKVGYDFVRFRSLGKLPYPEQYDGSIPEIWYQVYGQGASDATQAAQRDVLPEEVEIIKNELKKEFPDLKIIEEIND